MDKIYFAKTHKDAKIPTKSKENAGRDIYACFDKDYMILPKGCVTMVPTGIASAFSDEYYIQLQERGSTGTKGMTQHCGVIDSGFRNSWFVPIGNYTDKDIIISKLTKEEIVEKMNLATTNILDAMFMRLYFKESVVYPYDKAICQAVLLPVPKVEEVEISYDELLEMKSERGMGMIGSSGK